MAAGGGNGTGGDGLSLQPCLERATLVKAWQAPAGSRRSHRPAAVGAPTAASPALSSGGVGVGNAAAASLAVVVHAPGMFQAMAGMRDWRECQLGQPPVAHLGQPDLGFAHRCGPRPKAEHRRGRCWGRWSNTGGGASSRRLLAIGSRQLPVIEAAALCNWCLQA